MSTPQPTDRTPLTLDEARRILATATTMRLHVAFVLALALGLRRGEVLGLRWSDIDLTAGVLHVRQTLQHHGGALHFAPKDATITSNGSAARVDDRAAG
jgi:integrase